MPARACSTKSPAQNVDDRPTNHRWWISAQTRFTTATPLSRVRLPCHAAQVNHTQKPAVEHQVAPPALVKVINQLFRRILASPLHAPMSKGLMVLHITGRKTGHVYHIPVGRHELDGQLLTYGGGAWRTTTCAEARICSSPLTVGNIPRMRYSMMTPNVSRRSSPRCLTGLVTRRRDASASRSTSIVPHPGRDT